MSRLIDADALLAKFNKKSDIWTALTDEKTANDFALYCKVADAVEEMPTVGGWISVKDRLPEGEDDYLVIQHAHKPTVTLAWYSGDENGWQAIDGSFYADGIVTHYMPLPEPPKEEQENE